MKFSFKNILQGDKGIWIIIFFLAIFSILAVYSASAQLAFGRMGSGNTTQYLLKQIVMLMIGVGTVVFIHLIPYKYFSKISVYMWYFSILLLIITLIWGAEVNDAKRWLTLPGGFTFQTSDFAKVALIMYLSRNLALKEAEINTLRGSMEKIFAPIAITCGLILPAGLSTTVLLFGVCMLLLFMSKLKMKYTASMLGIVVGFGLLLLVFVQTDKTFGRSETWRSRIESFKDPNKPENIQEKHSRIAIATGGLFGNGPGQSIQKNILPHPYSDYIFAIIVEEFGLLLGAIPLIALYIFLFGRATKIVKKVSRKFGAYATAGLTCLITLQALSNMAVATGIFPVTGQPLPFVSLGGTSIIFTGMAFGIILSVSREVKQNEKQVMEEVSDINTSTEDVNNTELA
jgi:cell division protein FtsW